MNEENKEVVIVEVVVEVDNAIVCEHEGQKGRLKGCNSSSCSSSSSSSSRDSR